MAMLLATPPDTTKVLGDTNSWKSIIYLLHPAVTSCSSRNSQPLWSLSHRCLVTQYCSPADTEASSAWSGGQGTGGWGQVVEAGDMRGAADSTIGSICPDWSFFDLRKSCIDPLTPAKLNLEKGSRKGERLQLCFVLPNFKY